jgi:hypothetical protein
MEGKNCNNNILRKKRIHMKRVRQQYEEVSSSTTTTVEEEDDSRQQSTVSPHQKRQRLAYDNNNPTVPTSINDTVSPFIQAFEELQPNNSISVQRRVCAQCIHHRFTNIYTLIGIDLFLA